MKFIENFKFIGKLKWWQMLILFPSSMLVLLGACKEGWRFVQYDIRGKPVMSVIEERNYREFKKHFQEEPYKKEIFNINGSHIRVAYYNSDECMMISRGRDIIWLPKVKKQLITYGKLKSGVFIKNAWAGKKSFHNEDLNYKDYFIEWISKYEFTVTRRFSDKCTIIFKVWAPTGKTCCYEWAYYQHEAS